VPEDYRPFDSCRFWPCNIVPQLVFQLFHVVLRSFAVEGILDRKETTTTTVTAGPGTPKTAAQEQSLHQPIVPIVIISLIEGYLPEDMRNR